MAYEGKAESVVRVSSAGLFFLIFSLFSFSAYAVDVSGGASAGQIEKRFETVPEPKSEPRFIFIPRMSGYEAPKGSEKIRFVLNEISFDGLEALDKADINYLYADLLKQEITLKQIYELATKLTSHYGNSGYLLSKAIVPPQTIENGRIRILVVEGYIDEVVIEGLSDNQSSIFDHYIKQIKNSRPLTSAVLERYLMLANDLPGVSFKSVLSASTENVGATVLTLTATKKQYQGAISLDNRGSETSGPWQVLLEAGVNDLFNRLDNTTLRIATVPDDTEELHYLQLSHQQILNGEGLKVLFDVSATESLPGGNVLQSLDVETESFNFGATLSYPWIRSRERNLTFSGGLHYRESETQQLGLQTADDQFGILKLGVLFDNVDTWMGGGVNLLSLSLHQGLDVSGSQVTSRATAEPGFTSLNIHVSRNQSIVPRLSARLRVTGQLTDETLPSSEQFSLGGENSVRGYEPSEFTGDRALAGSLELVYHLETEWEGDVNFYGFHEEGKVWRENPQVGENRTDSLSAWGFGTRIQFPGDISLNLEAANPLDRDSNGNESDWQLYGRIRMVL